MEQTTKFWAFAGQADGNPPGCDHVGVYTDDGKNWGCFGRGGNEMKAQGGHMVAEGEGYSKWADYIDTPKAPAEAGLINQTSGRCHNVANRILAVVGKDVRGAGADVVLMFYYGKYGFDIPSFINMVKSGAAAVNAQSPDTISADTVASVIATINNAKQDELEIIEEFFETALGPQALSLTSDEKSEVAKIYSDFFDERAAIEGDPDSYPIKLKPIILENFKKLETLLGPDRFQVIFKAAPPYALDYLKGFIPGIA